MAGIGVSLKKIYGKNTLTTDILGAGYSNGGWRYGAFCLRD